jgi:hypothetical protein
LPSDELFPSTKDPKIQWEGLEKRVNSLLEGIVKLRNANGELMKENIQLKKQLKDTGGNASSSSNGSSEELQNLRKQYDEAIQDLKQVKSNLQRIESLSKDLKLEG